MYSAVDLFLSANSADSAPSARDLCGCAVVFSCLLLFSGACKSSPTPSSKEIIVWKPLGNWSGHNLMQTEAFISDSGSLRIIWETKNETAPGKGVFTVTLHSGVSGRPLLEAVSHQGAGHDVAYVNEDPREFFLVIDAANVDWTVEVSEAFPGQDRSHPNR